MIGKNKSKHLFYIDRDTDIDKLIERMVSEMKNEWRHLFETEKNNLQAKATEFVTVENNLTVGNTEMQRMTRFYKGAVLPYYYRQEYGDWDHEITSDQLDDIDKEVKRKVGFVLYDHTGMKTNEVNSTTTFKLARDFADFLNDIENVCFTDNGYIFPDSDEYKKREKKYGVEVAKAWAANTLKEKILNKYKDRVIV